MPYRTMDVGTAGRRAREDESGRLVQFSWRSGLPELGICGPRGSTRWLKLEREGRPLSRISAAQVWMILETFHVVNIAAGCGPAGCGVIDSETHAPTRHDISLRISGGREHVAVVLPGGRDRWRHPRASLAVYRSCTDRRNGKVQPEMFRERPRGTNQ